MGHLRGMFVSGTKLVIMCEVPVEDWFCFFGGGLDFYVQ